MILLNVVDVCMTGPDRGATGSRVRICPYCMYCLFGNLLSLGVYLAQPEYSGEGLDLPSSNVPYTFGGLEVGVVGGYM